MYQNGKLYVWQNQVGEYAALNGMETRVVDGPFRPSAENDQGRQWWETNSLPPGQTDLNVHYMAAYEGDLVAKG